MRADTLILVRSISFPYFMKSNDCVFTNDRSNAGKTLSNGGNVSITAVDGQYTLTINNVQKSDGGEYTITAANDFGQLSCTASLVVTGMQFDNLLI